MIAKKSTNPTYDYYYDMPEVTMQPDGGNEIEVDLPNSGNAVDDIPWEYVDEEDAGVYVLERKVRSRGSIGREVPAPEANRPGHQRAEPGVYDELDYDLSPRIDGRPNNSTNLEKGNGCSKQKKILILSVLGTLIIGLVAAGVVLALQRKYCFQIVSNNLLENIFCLIHPLN